jgi:hypothetical protein
LHNHCFLPEREAQKLAFAHFNKLKQNFRWRPQFTDQRQQISHLLAGAAGSASTKISFCKEISLQMEALVLNPPGFWANITVRYCTI